MKRTQQQNKQLHAIIGQIGLGKEAKAALVSSVTKGRTETSKELTVRECNILISHLNDMHEDTADKRRKYVLSICHRMEWYKDGKLDMYRLDNFCLNRSAAKKRFNNQNAAELRQLCAQFDRLFKHHKTTV